MKREIYERARLHALELYEKAHIILTEQEKRNVEVADFGLEDLENTGLELVTYVNTDRVCAKEMVLFPGQTCPEHIHVPFGTYPGKEEVFRCRYGTVYLYVDGEACIHPAAQPPEASRRWYTVFHEEVLHPGDQFVIVPNTKHWFRAGPEGAVVSEFSTTSFDEYDRFTDPAIIRIPSVEE